MIKFTKSVIHLLFLFLLITGCREKEWEEYYDRPASLEDPIYLQLQSRGNFSFFLKCIDKAGYKSTLGSAGFYTVFAPNDAAFEKYFQKEGITIEDVDTTAAKQIVQYSIVYNAFLQNQLSDYQSNAGWVKNFAFKRRTAYYSGPYYGDINGQKSIIISSNRNGGYLFGDNNNKYIPYFENNFIAANGYSAQDYSVFFPNKSYTGFNVATASTVSGGTNILAENGVIHEVDEVILPLPNIEEYLANKPEYSDFKDLLEKYFVAYYPASAYQDLVIRAQKMMKSTEPVYVKIYSSGLAFSPNNENYMKAEDNDGQSDGWTLFAPTNEALKKYIDTVLLRYYTKLEYLPASVLTDFVNAQMSQRSIWPGKFSSNANHLGEIIQPKMNDIVDAKMLSNGVFYGSNKVQHANVFRSVFGKAYLDPRYSLMTRFLQRELKSSIISPNIKYTLFLISDDSLKNAGYSYNAQTSEWLYKGATTDAVNNLTRIMNYHVIEGQSINIADSGVVETYGSEYIKFSNGYAYSAGNKENLTAPKKIDSMASCYNGVVYYLDGMLAIPKATLGKSIRDLGQIDGPYEKFYNYLSRSSLFNTTTNAIVGVNIGTLYTVFIPTNAAIDQAVADGVLPANPATTDGVEKDRINSFIYYHIVPRFILADNGKENDVDFETMYKDAAGISYTVHIESKAAIGKVAGSLEITDLKGRKAKASSLINTAGSTEVVNYGIIHLIDTYLNYGVN